MIEQTKLAKGKAARPLGSYMQLSVSCPLSLDAVCVFMEIGKFNSQALGSGGQTWRVLYLLDQVKIDALALEHQELLVEKGIGLLIGNDFLDEYLITIDWGANKLYLHPVEN